MLFRSEINFNKMKSLELDDLPSLTSFCSANQQAFNFPSLEQVMVDQCSRMITFSSGPLFTPKLQGIRKDLFSDQQQDLFRDQQQWEGSLNETITSLLEEWVRFIFINYFSLCVNNN